MATPAPQHEYHHGTVIESLEKAMDMPGDDDKNEVHDGGVVTVTEVKYGDEV